MVSRTPRRSDKRRQLYVDQQSRKQTDAVMALTAKGSTVAVKVFEGEVEYVPKGCAVTRASCWRPYCNVCGKYLLSYSEDGWADPQMQYQAGAWYCGECFVHMTLLTAQSLVGYNHD